MKKRFKQHELSDNVFVFDDGYRGECPLEDSDLIAFKWWMDYRFPDVLWFHPSQETKSNSVQHLASRARKGVRSGVSDVIILTPGVRWHKATIELKRHDSMLSKWQPGQIPFLNDSASAGAFSAVACGLDQIKIAVLTYFGLISDVD